MIMAVPVYAIPKERQQRVWTDAKDEDKQSGSGFQEIFDAAMGRDLNEKS